MSPSSKYILPSVDAAVQHPEDGSKGNITGAGGEKETMLSRRQENVQDSAMSLTRTSSSRQRDMPRRSHRSTPGSNTGRNSNRGKGRPSSSRHISHVSRDESAGSTQHRHRHMRLHPSGESWGSSSGEEEVVDHHTVLEAAAARGRLTSPSLVSTLTSLTTATSNSGSSSGSNSTVTQASMSRSLVPTDPEPTPEAPKALISPGMAISVSLVPSLIR